MQKETTPPLGVMVVTVGLFIGSDMCFNQPCLLAIFDIHIGFLDADLSGAYGFDLTPL